jgi:hypothetical protein
VTTGKPPRSCPSASPGPITARSAARADRDVHPCSTLADLVRDTGMILPASMPGPSARADRAEMGEWDDRDASSVYFGEIDPLD